MTTKKTPEEVVLAWNERYSKRDIDGALEFMSDDFKRYGDTTNWEPIDKHRWANPQKGFMLAFPDWTWDLKRIVASGDWVVCEFEEHGTWTEPFEPSPGVVLPPTGTSYLDHDGIWFRVNEDGLIAEIHAYITNDIFRAYPIFSKSLPPDRGAPAD